MNDDLNRQLAFEENRKSIGIAYLLWLMLGGFGVHRFYAGATKSGVAQLLLLITLVGWIVLIPWLLADLFLIPGLVREQNAKTMSLLGYGQPAPASEGEARPVQRKDTAQLDPRRRAMLEDLRKTGYKKERRDRIFR